MKKLFIFPFSVFGAFLLSTSLPAQDQPDAEYGLAGPDKHTCKMNGFTNSVKIGPTKGSLESTCYYWTPATGLSDQHAGNPEASPPTTTTYTLKAVFDNFEKEIVDQVTVYVDEIDEFTISPKKCCFKPGDPIKNTDFNITTIPAGLEDQVYFEETTVPWIQEQEKQYPIIAKIKCDNEYSIAHSVTITIVNSSNVTTSQFSFGPVKKAIEAVETITKYLEKGTHVPGNPCPVAATSPQLNLFQQDGKICCPNAGCVVDMTKIGGSFKICAGQTCDIPFVGWPGLATFNAVIFYNFCQGVQLDYANTCDGGDVCFTGTNEMNFGGGISGTVLGGAAARVAGVLNNQIWAPPFKFCIPSKKVEFMGTLCYEMTAVLQIQFLSGAAGWQWKYPLIPKVCL